jgi:hypothetical protein
LREKNQSACSAGVLHLPHHIRLVFSDAIFAGAHSRTRLVCSLAQSLTGPARSEQSEFSFELAASGGFKKVTERRAHKIFSVLVNRAGGGGGGVVSNKRNGSTTLLFIRGARAASSGCMQERDPAAYTAMRTHLCKYTGRRWRRRERIYNSDAAKHSKIAIRPAQHLKNVSPPRRALSTMLFA